MDLDIRNDITYLGETDFRGKRTRFGIKPDDRAKHMYVIGKTGMGKSTFLENLAVQDILRGDGIAFFDPHGASVEVLLDYIPEERVKDVIYFAPFDEQYPISFNVMEDVDPDKRSLVANGLLEAFKKIWPDAFSARMEYILNNAMLALLEYPDATILGINRMLSDKEYRKKVVDNITDQSVKSFWVDEFGSWTEKFASEASSAIQNKIGQFTTSPIIRNIVGQPKSSFDFRQAMDSKKIILVNLSKGKIGSQNSALIGSMLVTKLYLAAMSRADVTKEIMKNLPPMYLYVDEFQNFANDSFADILSEARKYKLALIVAHQYVAQMPDTVRDAIIGNIGSMIIFRVGPEDAELFEREFVPVFTKDDIVNIGKYQMYLRLMIEGVGSKPFSARALAPIQKPAVSHVNDVVASSRALYAENRSEVEEGIKEFYTPIPSEKQVEYGNYLEKRKMEILAGGGTWIDKESGKVLKGEGEMLEQAKAYLAEFGGPEGGATAASSETPPRPTPAKAPYEKPAYNQATHSPRASNPVRAPSGAPAGRPPAPAPLRSALPTQKPQPTPVQSTTETSSRPIPAAPRPSSSTSPAPVVQKKTQEIAGLSSSLNNLLDELGKDKPTGTPAASSSPALQKPRPRVPDPATPSYQRTIPPRTSPIPPRPHVSHQPSETVSLNDLKQGGKKPGIPLVDKSASSSTKSALALALEKAMAAKQVSNTSPAITPSISESPDRHAPAPEKEIPPSISHISEPKPIPSSFIQEKTEPASLPHRESIPSDQSFMSRTIKEVPEDVLRRVLE